MVRLVLLFLVGAFLSAGKYYPDRHNAQKVHGEMIKALPDSCIFYVDAKLDADNSSGPESVVVRIYWDEWGNYLKYELPEKAGLRKVNGKVFSDKDYLALHKLLIDKDSGIQYYELDNLSSQNAERAYYSVDATSGATTISNDYDAVRGGVKTCSHLWNVVHRQRFSDEVRKRIKNSHSCPGFGKISECSFVDLKRESTSCPVKKKIRDVMLLQNPSIEAISKLNTMELLTMLQLMRQFPENMGSHYAAFSDFMMSTRNEFERVAVYNYLKDVDYRDRNMRRFSYYVRPLLSAVPANNL